ncbi:MAG: ribosome maturation factor RimP [Candidatus Cloacimonetes bacterium]|nr:ribosome maturation factor RimP [Candidatus Cloacimonadota bacterium]MCF7813493.1 ribosome maturation factor RimP [Candidatus Cloacimonadota bacterium]MCF7868584.1 ribosome maturation factor RimP [Candidatus Cloacimonadota bacterium]MCF7883371.1 ribosome maturation factor RimP [Candidatus Cloacimonadota bacterium]
MEKIMVEKLEKIAKEACSKQGVALYDLELKRASKGLIVLVYITKLDGVNIGDCQIVSREISNRLEIDDFIAERFFLEVSSPGLERELKLKKHYVSAIGEKLKITFQAEDKNKTVIGVLKEVETDYLKLDVKDEMKQITFSDIKKAKTYFDYKKKS